MSHTNTWGMSFLSGSSATAKCLQQEQIHLRASQEASTGFPHYLKVQCLCETFHKVKKPLPFIYMEHFLNILTSPKQSLSGLSDTSGHILEQMQKINRDKAQMLPDTVQRRRPEVPPLLHGVCALATQTSCETNTERQFCFLPFFVEMKILFRFLSVSKAGTSVGLS